ncbi:MAG: tetratricopeptide repeat protein, partial [Nitrospinota bacterium]
MRFRGLLSGLAVAVLLSGCAPLSEEVERNFLRGNRFLGEGLPQMAIQAYRRALSEDDARPEVWFNLGLAQLRTGKPAEAAVSFRRSLRLKPSPEVWYNLGVAELRADNPARAVTALNRSVALEPRRPAAWNNLGVSYRRLGRYPLAEEAFRKAFSLDRNDPKILNNFAWLYLVWRDAGAERKKKALELAKKAEAKSRGKNARILATLAEAYFANDDGGTAVRTMERALRLDPGNAYRKKRLSEYRGSPPAPGAGAPGAP